MTTIRTYPTADALNSLVEFDSPFRVTPAGELHTCLDGIYAPEVTATHHEEGDHTRLDLSDVWAPITGYSGQHRYSGPIMHVSEDLSGKMAEDTLKYPGVYVLVTVEDGDDPEGEPYGWMLLKLKEGDE